MARNEEKHFCNLNKLILLKEKEEYEKVHPPRPRLSSLDTPEEVQKWLPSIKRDIDFYLKKSQVTCYSDAHIEECREKVVKLEKEFKAFVRKIKKLTPSPLDVIPWTNRPYKRKKTDKSEISFKEFKRIATPILDNEINSSLCESNKDDISPPKLCSAENNSPSIPKEDNVSQYNQVNWNLMDQPLTFTAVTIDQKKPETNLNVNTSNFETISHNLKNSSDNGKEFVRRTLPIQSSLINKTDQHQKTNQGDFVHRIVNYDSSDDENSL